MKRKHTHTHTHTHIHTHLPWKRARWNLSQLLVFTFWLPAGYVSGFLTASRLIVLLLKKGEKKLLADFKLVQVVFQIFHGSCRGAGLWFCLSCGFARMGARCGLLYSQVPSLQPNPSDCCAAPTVHLSQFGTFNSSCCSAPWGALFRSTSHPFSSLFAGLGAAYYQNPFLAV